MLLRRFFQLREGGEVVENQLSEFQYLRLVESCERVVREELVTRLLVPSLADVSIMGFRFLRTDIDAAELLRQRSGVRVSVSELLLTLHLTAIALPKALGLSPQSIAALIAWLGSCARLATQLRHRLAEPGARRHLQLRAFSTLLPFAGFESLLWGGSDPTAFAVLELTTTRLLNRAIGFWLERGRRSGKAGFELVY